MGIYEGIVTIYILSSIYFHVVGNKMTICGLLHLHKIVSPDKGSRTA